MRNQPYGPGVVAMNGRVAKSGLTRSLILSFSKDSYEEAKMAEPRSFR